MQKKIITKAAIIAGGKGTRLVKITKDIPKSLVKIGDKPVIEHQIVLLQKHNIKEIWILLGYLGDQIREYLGNGEKWNVNIHYQQEKKPLGTAGALKTLEKEIKEDFLVLSGDVMLDLDIRRFINWHKQKNSTGSIVVHPNDHPFDSDLVEMGSEEEIISFWRRPHKEEQLPSNLSIASVFIFSPKIFKYIPPKRQCDIEKDILPIILESKEKVYGYNTPEYIKDIGTPTRLTEVNRDYILGKIKKFPFKEKTYEA